MTDLPTEMLSVAEDLLTLAAPKQVEKMRDALLAAYERGREDGTPRWRAKLPADQMVCKDCGCIAYSDSVDVGVGLLVRGNFECGACGWEYDADGMMRVGSYDDYFTH